MSLKRNVPLLYAVQFFHKLIPAYVIERLFALERGMSIQAIVYVGILYALIVALLEVPSGVLADRLGRKKLLVIGGLCAFFEFFVVIFANGPALFVLSALFAAIGGACISGAMNALLYESLADGGQADRFEQVLGRMRVVGFLTGLFAALSGAYLAEQGGYTLNYWLSSASCLCGFFCALLLREPQALAEPGAPPPTYLAILRTAATFFRGHAGVLRILLLTTLTAACVEYADEFWQLYLRDAGFPLALFGLVSAALSLCQIPGSLSAARLLRRFPHERLLLAASLLTAIGLAWAACARGPLGLVGLLVGFFAFALMEPVAQGYLHHRADPSARATIDSVGNLMGQTVSAAVGLAFGVAAAGSVFNAFGLLAALAGAGCIVSAIALLRRQSPPPVREK